MMRPLCIVGGWALVSIYTACGATHAQDLNEPLKALSEFIAKRDCNSSNCHGSKVPEERLAKRAGDLWELYDPHSNAYLSLRTDQSLAIVRQLWTGADSQSLSVDTPEYQRFLEINCVSCHASEMAPATQRLAGVDCQSCHGSASAWDDSHLLQSWRDKKEKRFDEILPEHPSAKGRVNTSSPWTLAKVCGSCHVGDMNRAGDIQFDDGSAVPKQHREVSHRLMAAGHPPTYFEFGHYLRRYPKHWSDQDKIAGQKSFETANSESPSPIAGRELNTWRIGKIVNAHQRLDLLANRLNLAEWPEFTEHRCTSCHHPLNLTTETENRRLSNPYAQWDGWYLEQVDLALALTRTNPENTSGDSAISISSDLWNQHYKNLKGLLLNPLAAHQGESKSRIEREIKALQGILEQVIEKQLPLIEPSDLQKVRVDWAGRLPQAASVASWESAVQIQLAAMALGHHKNPAGEYPPFGKQAWDLPHANWKRSEPLPYAASSAFDWQRFYEQLQELKKSLD